MKRREHRKLGNLKIAKFIHSEKMTWSGGRASGSRRTGQLYEDKVMNHLAEEWDHALLVNPWFHYEEFGLCGKNAQPDGLIFDIYKGLIYLIECKLTHTTEAYHQMNNKYVPILEYLFPDFRIARVEIYKNMSGFRWPHLTSVIDSLNMIEHSGDYMWRLNI